MGKECPAHFDDSGIVITDRKRVDELRLALRDGIYRPWFDLGRAPTLDEIGERLGRDRTAVHGLIEELETCANTVHMGVLRAPESDLIATAWPLSNVPTGITVTLDGAKPVQARCAIDSLGVSKMMGKRALVESTMRGGVPFRAVVDGNRLVSVEPAAAVVLKGSCCDEMNFFPSQAAAEEYEKQRGIEGRIFAMPDAVAHASENFGRITEGLP
jgi:hypothetical protein